MVGFLNTYLPLTVIVFVINVIQNGSQPVSKTPMRRLPLRAVLLLQCLLSGSLTTAKTRPVAPPAASGHHWQEQRQPRQLHQQQQQQSPLRIILDGDTLLPDDPLPAKHLTSFTSPRIQRGVVVFDGSLGSDSSGVFTAPTSGDFHIRPAAWATAAAAEGRYVSVYGAVGGTNTVAFIGVTPNSGGIYVATVPAAGDQRVGAAPAPEPRLVLGSGSTLPGVLPGRLIQPSVGRGLRDLDANADTAAGIVFIALTDESFGVVLARAGSQVAGTASSRHGQEYSFRAIAVNGTTRLPGCPDGHATVGAVGIAPMLAQDGSAVAFFGSNGERVTEPTACEGLYLWCEHGASEQQAGQRSGCHTTAASGVNPLPPGELVVIADTRSNSAAPSAGDGFRFSAFGQASLSQSEGGPAGAHDVAFFAKTRSAAGDGRTGVYLQPAGVPLPPLRRVVDTTMSAPGGRCVTAHVRRRFILNLETSFDFTLFRCSGDRCFTGFDAVSVYSSAVVFRAVVAGQPGIYLSDRDGAIHTIAVRPNALRFEFVHENEL